MRVSKPILASTLFLLSGCGKAVSFIPTPPASTSDASVEDGSGPQAVDGSVAPSGDAGSGLVGPIEGGEDAPYTTDSGTDATAADPSDAEPPGDAADSAPDVADSIPDAADSAPDVADAVPDAGTPTEDGGAFTLFDSGINEPYGITVGSDGNIWFTEYGGGPGIGRITAAGILTEFSTPTPSSKPMWITSGPDGALWFTETAGQGNKIGRCTTGADGSVPTITEFVVPSMYAGLDDIVSGPDGALWFSEEGGDKIGRLAPDVDGGTITEFSLSGVSPRGLAFGADGALWFAQVQGAPEIGRLTTAGALSVFPTFSSLWPDRITAGPDGALWFTEVDNMTGSGIGRITTGSDGGSPTFTEFNVTEPVSGFLGGITPGPDGALWFAQPGRIGRITTAGAYSILAIPLVYAYPTGLTFAPDGALWFTGVRGASATGFIGRFAR
jgi:streptogramin lyase